MAAVEARTRIMGPKLRSEWVVVRGGDVGMGGGEGR
jgi:hypothetical protein